MCSLGTIPGQSPEDGGGMSGQVIFFQLIFAKTLTAISAVLDARGREQQVQMRMV